MKEANLLRLLIRETVSSKMKRPKLKVGATYDIHVGDRRIGTVGCMTEDQVTMDIDGRPYKIISRDSFNEWITKMPAETWWVRQY
jgi:hypothetical protein